jgi:hypothetical protein
VRMRAPLRLPELEHVPQMLQRRHDHGTNT